jgi:hypothetical protein
MVLACRHRGLARRHRCQPVIDCLDGKPPIATDAKRGQLISLQHPVNRRRMYPKVARYVTYRQDLAINFIESIHVIPLCYARLPDLSQPLFSQLPTRILSPHGETFFCGGGGQKGASRPCGRFFPAKFQASNPSVVKGVKNDRTTARVRLEVRKQSQYALSHSRTQPASENSPIEAQRQSGIRLARSRSKATRGTGGRKKSDCLTKP